MFYELGSRVAVVFGGQGAAVDDTWGFDGQTWALLSAPRPRALALAALAYDERRGETVLFGGYDGSFSAETWEWNGARWAQRASARVPPARRSHAMAYHATSGVTVMFGGSAPTPTSLDDTWEWDGTVWTQRSPTTRPSGRQSAGVAYDSARRRTVLFGGYSAAGKLSDTWEWDGNDWQRRFPTGGPPDMRPVMPSSTTLRGDARSGSA
jgi:hypothetical protein